MTPIECEALAVSTRALQSGRPVRERFFLDTRACDPIGEHFSHHGGDADAWPKRQKRALGLPIDDMGNSENRQVDTGHLEGILEKSLKEDDFYCRKSLRALMSLGLKADDARVLLAQYKSRVKYSYDISPESFSHIMGLAKTREGGTSLARLIESPFFLIKACWLLEHSPYFFFCDGAKSEDKASLIEKFAREYESEFLKSKVAIDTWEKMENPRRVMVSTFWDRQIFDPVLSIVRIRHHHIEGLELNVDFHPFNYTTLLPEEFSREKRQEIREACSKSGVKMDIHSPIVGPYVPTPDPTKGKQRFFDPANCLQIHYETIELAKEIGARCVVVHLIDTSNLKALVGLVEKAGENHVRVTIENCPYTKERQTSTVFIACLHEIWSALPRSLREDNFGVTFDVGHLNIDGEDPVIGAEKIGKWCLDHEVFLRVHATDNYGDLLFTPPAYSADVHGNVSGRGINNGIVVKLLRSMGHEFDVVAEQIHPLTTDDVATIHLAQSFPLDGPYESYVKRGKERLCGGGLKGFHEAEIVTQPAYQFLAGIESVTALREHLVFRKIQDKKHLSVDEAKRISQDFMRMPEKLKSDLTAYIDDLLLPVRTESGAIQKNELDLICQNISGALFATLNNEHLNQIFSVNRQYSKGDTICQQGMPGQETYFIKEGEVMVLIDDSCVATLGPGEIFGEISLFYNVNRSATIKAARERTRVGVLSRSGLARLFRGGEPYARALIYRLYNILPERLRNLNDKYKGVIRTLHLIWEDEDKSLLSLDVEMEIKRQQSDFVPTLSADEARAMCQEIRDFNAGQLICAEGDSGDGAYFILQGKVKAIGTSRNAKDVLLGELAEGEMFGEMALVDEKPRSATVVAVTPCKMAFIGKKAFDELMARRSDLAFRLMGFICLCLFRRILRLDKLYSQTLRRDRSTTSKDG